MLLKQQAHGRHTWCQPKNVLTAGVLRTFLPGPVLRKLLLVTLPGTAGAHLSWKPATSHDRRCAPDACLLLLTPRQPQSTMRQPLICWKSARRDWAVVDVPSGRRRAQVCGHGRRSRRSTKRSLRRTKGSWRRSNGHRRIWVRQGEGLCWLPWRKAFPLPPWSRPPAAPTRHSR